MSKARVAVLKVISNELTVTAAAETYGYSRRHLHRLLARYHAEGLDAVDARSRRPHTNPKALSDQIRDLIVELRVQLTRQGLDAGPVTIAWHLEQAGHRVPSTSTIRRILHTAELINPEPRKRPRSSYRRFQAAQPNECWQSDFTHWRLADNTDTEILNWLDDHSRYLLSCTAHTPVTGDTVVNEFLTTANDPRPTSLNTDRQRPRLHRALRRREERLRIPPRRLGHHPEERQRRPPADPGQGRATPPDPETLARSTTTSRHPGPAPNPTRQVPRPLQQQATPPCPRPRAHQQPPTPRYPRPAPPSTHPARFTTGCATTPSTPGAKSASDAPAGCTTSVSDTPTAAPKILAIADETTDNRDQPPHRRDPLPHDIDPTKAYWRNTQRAPGRWPGAL